MRRPLLAALALLTLSGMMPASAQETLEDARARRETIAEEAADNASRIDALEAEDAEIVAALEEIDTWIAIQEARLDRARQELAATVEVEAEAWARADALAARIGELQLELAAQLVDGYVQGFRNDDGLLLDTEDLNSVPLLRFVIDETSGATAATTDLLRLAQDQQADAIAEAEQARREAEDLRDEIEGRIADLEASRVVQEQLRA